MDQCDVGCARACGGMGTQGWGNGVQLAPKDLPTAAAPNRTRRTAHWLRIHVRINNMMLHAGVATAGAWHSQHLVHPEEKTALNTPHSQRPNSALPLHDQTV